MADGFDTPSIVALARSNAYTFSKIREPSLRLVAGQGVEGDVHCGETVRHRSRVAADPTRPNLRQVHLVQSELFSELHERGFEVEPGALGENVATRGIDLLGLPAGTRLGLGPDAHIEVTGLRNPCGQINGLQQGLLAILRTRDPSGEVVRRAGVMAVVIEGGCIETGDAIRVTLPREPHRPLECV